MITKKFDGHEAAQACINYYADGTIALQSYKTIVAEIAPGGWLKVNGLYSDTTRRHIGWFMERFGFTFQLAKQILTDNMLFNIFTGEFKAQ